MEEAKFEMPYLTQATDGTVLLHLHVQPKASKNRIVGLYDRLSEACRGRTPG